MLVKLLFGILLSVALVLGSALPVPAGGSGPELRTRANRYNIGKNVGITLVNGSSPLTFENPWRVKNSRDRTVARLFWEDHETRLAADERVAWVWDATRSSCATDGTCTAVGGSVPAGRYTAVVRTDAGKLRTSFLIGQYFTVGFDSWPEAEFVVFAARQKAVDEMHAEAEAEEPTKIVSGIVNARHKPYNPDWDFTMRPRTIVLGEVFMEVCDGSPYYVQEHRRDWHGTRWCPWSSYVKRVGR